METCACGAAAVARCVLDSKPLCAADNSVQSVLTQYVSYGRFSATTYHTIWNALLRIEHLVLCEDCWYSVEDEILAAVRPTFVKSDDPWQRLLELADVATLAPIMPRSMWHDEINKAIEALGGREGMTARLLSELRATFPSMTLTQKLKRFGPTETLTGLVALNVIDRRSDSEPGRGESTTTTNSAFLFAPDGRWFWVFQRGNGQDSWRPLPGIGGDGPDLGDLLLSASLGRPATVSRWHGKRTDLWARADMEAKPNEAVVVAVLDKFGLAWRQPRLVRAPMRY